MSLQADVEAKLEALYITSEDFTLTLTERKEKQQAQETELSALVDEAENDDSLSKAMKLVYRGNLLNVSDQYNKQAEACLSKAVKLEPSLVDAWNSLGNCFCKKRDMKSAKNCFLQAIRQKKNKQSLRDLSMVLRNPLLGESKDRRDNVNEGAKVAKEALALDMKDGRSWYVLGNAYLTQFFEISQDQATLNNALKAYIKAEALGDTIPDLYYNRASVSRYIEDYAGAIADYAKATKLDPSLPGVDAVESITRLVTKITGLVHTKSGLKAKRLDALITNIPTTEKKVGEKEVCDINDLAQGTNESKTLFVKVVSPVNKESAIPVSLIVCDHTKQFAVASLYNVAPTFLNFVKVGDLLQLIAPACKSISLSGDGGGYTCLQMFQPDRMAVNGSPLDKRFYAMAQIVNENK